MNDPALGRAADAIEPFLRASYPRQYAGILLDHAQHAIVIYRLPGPSLDAAVRQRLQGITVEFRDARWSLAQMEKLVLQIDSDTPYWQTQGITVNGVGPATNGSAVEVMVERDEQQAQAAFVRRYGEGTVRVTLGSAMGILGVPYTPPASNTPGG